MQNEIIRLMTIIILRDTAKNINDSIYYSIMADELADHFWLPIFIHPKLVVKQRSYQECTSLIQPLLSILWKVDDETVSKAQYTSAMRISRECWARYDGRKIQILREHELYDKEQICTLHRKSKRSAKCSGCKNI